MFEVLRAKPFELTKTTVVDKAALDGVLSQRYGGQQGRGSDNAVLSLPRGRDGDGFP